MGGRDPGAGEVAARGAAGGAEGIGRCGREGDAGDDEKRPEEALRGDDGLGRYGRGGDADGDEKRPEGALREDGVGRCVRGGGADDANRPDGALRGGAGGVRARAQADRTPAALSAIASLFRWWFIHIADKALSVPLAPCIVRLSFFYVFMQALGLLWGFVVVLLQVLSQRLVEWLLSGTTSGSPVAIVGSLYVLFASLEMVFLCAGSLWTIAWEGVTDFPTFRKMMLKDGGHPSLPNLVPMTIPPLVIMLIFAASSAAPTLCASAAGGTCGGGWLADQFFTHDGHGNRMLRASLVILMLQWGQLFETLSPTGLLGLVEAAPKRRMALAVLVPMAVWRMWHFTWRPTDYVFNGNEGSWVSRHSYDNLLALLWGAWLSTAVAWAPTHNGCGMQLHGSTGESHGMGGRSKSDSQLLRGTGAGARRRDFTVSPEMGKQISWRFQYTFVVSAVSYFLRSLLSPDIGWTFAQNDLVALCTLYPAMVVLTWSATYAAMALKRVRPRWAVWFMFSGAGAAVAVWPGVQTALAALHVMRQVIKLFGAKSVRYAVRSPRSAPGAPMVRTDSGGAVMNTDSLDTRQVEKKYARRCAGCLVLIWVVWFCLLSSLMLLSAAQKYLGFFPGHMEFEASGSPGNATLHIAHKSIIGSHLTLVPDPTVAQPPSTYAICGHEFGGLPALDYALLSLAAYWDRDDPRLAGVMDHFFPAGKAPVARVVNGSDSAELAGQSMPWLEFGLPELGKRVVAVRGTDPTKISDVVEDIKMWTEPVVLGILSVVFPTIHMWPGSLVDNWVSSTHGLLKGLELEAGPWMWEPVATHLRAPARETGAPERQPATELTVTGHSLGAGIAQVAAALTGASVVAISPPGLMESFTKHRERSSASGTALPAGGVHAAHRRSVSVVVEGDWISRFDSHAGFVQTIACDRSDLAVFGGCHLLESTICQILTACGDPRGRWQRCEHSFKPHSEVVSLLMQLPAEVALRMRSWSRSLAGDAALKTACAAIAVCLLFLPAVPDELAKGPLAAGRRLLGRPGRPGER